MLDQYKSAPALVDTERYPIDRTGSVERQNLVEQCRTDLDRGALCYLPGFLHTDSLHQMSEEMGKFETVALRNEYLRTAYGWMNNSGFSIGHPRSTLFWRRYSYLITDQVPMESMVRALFFWGPLTQFVRDALGFKSLYRSECPTLSIQLNFMYEGDVLPWHFDTNDGVVSLLIDKAEEGGEFQVAPYVRDEGNENYGEVLQAFAGDPSVVQEPAMPPGTFILFKGRRSLHRVSPVGPTKRPRTIALYSYDEQPGMKFPQQSQDRLRYPNPSPYLGAQTPQGTTGFSIWGSNERI